MIQIKRGDIYLVDLSPVVGSEIKGVRPAIVIQNDIGNRFAPTVMLAAITSKINKSKLPTQVDLDSKISKLKENSVVLLEQIRTVDKMRLIKKISSLADNPEIMEKINEAYLISGGIIPFDEVETQTEKEYYKYKIDNILDILEDIEYEFKEIKGPNPKNSINSHVGPYATAFLNSEGGRILFGITDEGKVRGFEANRNLIDDIKLSIYDSLRNIQPTLSADHYQIIFHPVYNKDSEEIKDLYILELVVPPGRNKRDIYFFKGSELHIRVDGAKQLLKANEIISFIQRKLND